MRNNKPSKINQFTIKLGQSKKIESQQKSFSTQNQEDDLNKKKDKKHSKINPYPQKKEDRKHSKINSDLQSKLRQDYCPPKYQLHKQNNLLTTKYSSRNQFDAIDEIRSKIFLMTLDDSINSGRSKNYMQKMMHDQVQTLKNIRFTQYYKTQFSQLKKQINRSSDFKVGKGELLRESDMIHNQFYSCAQQLNQIQKQIELQTENLYKIAQKIDIVKQQNVNLLLEIEDKNQKIACRDKQEIEKQKTRATSRLQTDQISDQFLYQHQDFLDKGYYPINDIAKELNQLQKIQVRIFEIHKQESSIISQNNLLKQQIFHSSSVNPEIIDNFLLDNYPNQYKSIEKKIQDSQGFESVVNQSLKFSESLPSIISLLEKQRETIVNEQVQKSILNSLIDENTIIQSQIEDRVSRLKQFQEKLVDLQAQRKQEEAQIGQYIFQINDSNNKMNLNLLEKQKVINSLELELQSIKQQHKSNQKCKGYDRSKMLSQKKEKYLNKQIPKTKQQQSSVICSHCNVQIEGCPHTCLKCKLGSHLYCSGRCSLQ